MIANLYKKLVITNASINIVGLNATEAVWFINKDIQESIERINRKFSRCLLKVGENNIEI